ncbi:uncharacterized protein LOC111028124, partial [Myzus persicae]|uniref:uncharacterized protein LOC111028124 n=1 Tax=Myzus persicae TaxID=13164 RepID=UPI000B933038
MKNKETEVIENETLMEEYKEQMCLNRVYVCVVKTCVNGKVKIQTKNCKLLKFPNDITLVHEWLKNCERLDLGFKSLEYLLANVRVCGKHFAPKMFSNTEHTRLLPKAVPTEFESTKAKDPESSLNLDEFVKNFWKVNVGNNMTAYVGLNHMSFDHRSGEWKTFKLKLTNSLIAGDVSSDLKMKAILITALSDETLSLLSSLCVPLDIEAKSFNNLIKLLDAHFTPVKSYFSARYEFYRAEKNPMETVAEWAARVRTLSIPYGFGTELNIVLKDIFTLGLDKQFKERLFEEDATNKIITMNKMMDIALAKEMASK